GGGGGGGARKPLIQVRDLLADRTWAQALDQAFPIRMEFRLEIWRSREGWLDDFQRATEWSMVIQREPLQDVYRITRILLSGPEDFRFATRDDLDRWVRQVNQIDVVPRGTGSFYYNVLLRITALSDEDMEELERFLSGADPEAPRQQPSTLGRSVRRFLLRMAGLPLQDLEARSERFVVR
ncbi:MAG TPA: DUF4390 domain-containing protein, partial [Gemmatimonadales bacterium]|nr:DUF4390 domain-containing protein [Gemmatimonadales bacterium]